MENQKNIALIDKAPIEYFYILKNTDTNQYYFGQSKVGSNRLSNHQTQKGGFTFTHYILFQVYNSKQAEKQFMYNIYYHQKKDKVIQDYEEPFEYAYWGVQPGERHPVFTSSKDQPEFFYKTYRAVELDGVTDYTIPHYPMAFNWWKNGKGFSTIQSFTDKDLLEYIVKHETWYPGQTFLEWSAMNAERLKSRNYFYLHHIHRIYKPVKWQKEEKYKRRKTVDISWWEN